MDRILVTYHLSTPAGTPQSAVDARAMAIAVEQSIEMPVSAVRDQRVLDDYVGHVESVTAMSPELYRIRIALSTGTLCDDPGQLMNMLFGNSSLQPDVELVDVELGPEVIAAFPGPRFGIAGLRQATGTTTRPLTCSALKPQGSSPEQLAAIARSFALAGIDIIKDDHGIADQAYAPFAARVKAVQAAVTGANRETGGRTLYAPSLSGGPSRLAAQAAILRDEGAGMALIAPMIVGLPAFAELVATLGVPVIAHPALGGAARIAPPLLIGKLLRLFGADAVIYPNHGGRFSYSPQTCRDIAAAARGAWGNIRPALPVPAGGMTMERVPEMLDFYGNDAMLLIGGGLLEAGDSMQDRAREFVQTVAGTT
jgi:ribulose-bisphosphate carboxylase large chain